MEKHGLKVESKVEEKKTEAKPTPEPKPAQKVEEKTESKKTQSKKKYVPSSLRTEIISSIAGIAFAVIVVLGIIVYNVFF